MSVAGDSGQARDLRAKSREELLDMLRRQQRLLADKKFIHKLPDKGKKILESVEKVKFAIAQQEEVKRRTENLSAVRFQIETKDKHFNKSKGSRIVQADGDQHSNLDTEKIEALKSPSLSDYNEEQINQNFETCLKSDIKRFIEQRSDEKCVKEMEQKSIADHENASHMSEIMQEAIKNNYLEINQQTSTNDSQNLRDESRDALWKDAEMLANSFQGVTIKDEDNNNETSKRKLDMASRTTNNVFFTLNNGIAKQPNYIEVLERRAKNPVMKTSKFRTNRLPAGSNDSSCSSSPSHSSNRIESPISAEERRVLEKKHLNDITAARLPPLYHMPTQLLPLEESMKLQLLQNQSYEEMQAKLAAQRLAEKLNIKMVTYSPKDEASMKYREVLNKEEFSE